MEPGGTRLLAVSELVTNGVRASRAMGRDVVRIRLVSDLRQMHDAIERTCTTIGDGLARLEVIISRLRLDRARMRANLALDDGLITAEAVMIKPAQAAGRQQAHEIVHRTAQAPISSQTAFRDQLSADPRLT